MTQPLLTEAVTTELLVKYDRPGPRYTSYPTAVEFSEDFTADDYVAKLAEAASVPDEPLSLYIHLPFCQERCTFCGCNVIITGRAGIAATYVDYLLREIPMIAEHLGERRRVVQYHWGGGTPTYQNIEEMRRIHSVVQENFEFAEDSEIAIEVDPRVTSDEQMETLRGLGFNRLSMGVQDFSPDVQEAINRGQTYEETAHLFEVARALGFTSINIDLIYGLPHQTAAKFRKTLELAIGLRPDRIACYSFAFIPWIRGSHKKIRKEDLPTGEEKLRLFGIAIEEFTSSGYEMIGMDHFALPGDELATAAQSRTLHRNFMGYTVKPAQDMIGFGVSAIGDVRGAFAQNTKKLNRYYEAIDAGHPPIHRGYVLDADDLLRREVITRLMCNFHLDKSLIEARHGITFDEYFAEELLALVEPEGHGFVTLTPGAIEVVGPGRLFIRNICMIFDRHLRRKKGEGPVFSRTV